MFRAATDQTPPAMTSTDDTHFTEEQKNYLRNTVKSVGKLSFEEIIAAYNDRIGVIFNFLAILELLQLEEIGVEIGEGFNSFWIIKKD